jgi:hypothetical protein
MKIPGKVILILILIPFIKDKSNIIFERRRFLGEQKKSRAENPGFQNILKVSFF